MNLRKQPVEAFLGVINSKDVIPAMSFVELNQTFTEDIVNKNSDIILSGTIKEPVTVTGKSVALKNMTIKDKVVTISAKNDVILNNTNTYGSFPKDNGNTILTISSKDTITIKDCTFNTDDAYNAIEIGLKEGNVKQVIIENVKFKGNFTNNLINVFGNADNAQIDIINCEVESCSNFIRISNKNNNRITLNIKDCKVNKWEQGSYAGLIICQDYTSGSAEKAEENNLFAPSKVTVNIENVQGPSGLIEPKEPQLICGTQNENQIIYIFDEAVVPYNTERYPNINIK